MDVSIGLPNAVPGTSGGELVEWARRAEARGFSSLGTIDRIVYRNYEPLTALAAAAAVTERIGLCTSVLLGPLRTNAAELAKQALSLHALSDGRFTLGIGLGAREDDYEASGVEMRAGAGARRDARADQGGLGGRRDRPLDRAARRASLVGGTVDASFARAARFGDGWIAGGSGARAVRRDGGEGKGRLVGGGPRGRAAARRASPTYSLGERAEEDAKDYLRDYYAWLGEEIGRHDRRRRRQGRRHRRRYMALRRRPAATS